MIILLVCAYSNMSSKQSTWSETDGQSQAGVFVLVKSDEIAMNTTDKI
jgi:hypothetical protein